MTLEEKIAQIQGNLDNGNIPVVETPVKKEHKKLYKIGACPFNECDGSGGIMDYTTNTLKKCRCHALQKSWASFDSAGIIEKEFFAGFKTFETNNNPTLEKAKEIAIMYYKAFDNIYKSGSRFNSMLICGPAGRGKSTLGLRTIQNIICSYNEKATYMPYRIVIEEIKKHRTYDSSGLTKEELIDKYKKANILFIDDLYKGEPTSVEMNMLYEIIEYRYQKHLPMIVTTEYTTDSLVKKDEAVGSRIIECCKNFIIEMTEAPNYRTN